RAEGGRRGLRQQGERIGRAHRGDTQGGGGRQIREPGPGGASRVRAGAWRAETPARDAVGPRVPGDVAPRLGKADKPDREGDVSRPEYGEHVSRPHHEKVESGE